MKIVDILYPILFILLIFAVFRNVKPISRSHSIRIGIVISAYFLPWLISFLSTEVILVWIAFELASLLHLTLLKNHLSEMKLSEAWTKQASSWVLAWVFLGLAIGCSGIEPLPLWFFAPWRVENVYPVHAALTLAFFTVGLMLKVGLPPFQQGPVDYGSILRSEDQRLLALIHRWSLVYAVWVLSPQIAAILNEPSLHFIMVILFSAWACACLVCSVQAHIRRALAYLGSLTILPFVAFFSLADLSSGFSNAWLVLSFWLASGVNFILLALLCLNIPDEKRADYSPIWTDYSDDQLARFSRYWRWFATWNLMISGIILVQLISLKFWAVVPFSLLLSFSIGTAGFFQMGMHSFSRKQS